MLLYVMPTTENQMMNTILYANPLFCAKTFNHHELQEFEKEIDSSKTDPLKSHVIKRIRFDLKNAMAMDAG